MTRKWVWGAMLASLLLSGLQGGALHAEPSHADRAAARALFEEGRQLAAAGRHPEACVKLEESQKLDPGGGTLFHLADCYEHMGKTATAWGLYLEVASLMSLAGQHEREQAARDRAKELESKLSRIVIEVAPAVAQAPGLVVRRNGAVVGRGVWGSAIPADPGMHVLEVTADGRKPWMQTVELGKDGARATVTVPALEPVAGLPPASATAIVATPPASSVAPVRDPAPAVSQDKSVLSAPMPTQPARPDGAGRRALGGVVGGLGIVGLGVSFGLVLSAKSKFNDSGPYCSGNVCSQPGVDLRDQALDRANVATWVGAIGIVALAAGIVIYATAPSRTPSKSASSSLWIAGGPGAISVQGNWQ
jgi:hypothetical protein